MIGSIAPGATLKLMQDKHRAGQGAYAIAMRNLAVLDRLTVGAIVAAAAFTAAEAVVLVAIFYRWL